MTAAQDMPVLARLDHLVDLVRRTRDPLYVRWSRGPHTDLRATTSSDDLTGIPLPGLSVNALAVEPWWDGRPLRLWVARRLYDYCHLRREKGPGVRPWVLSGREVGRGPDNEPLVQQATPIAWIDAEVISEAQEEVSGQRGTWGPLRRASHAPEGTAPGSRPADAAGTADPDAADPPAVARSHPDPSGPHSHRTRPGGRAGA